MFINTQHGKFFLHFMNMGHREPLAAYESKVPSKVSTSVYCGSRDSVFNIPGKIKTRAWEHFFFRALKKKI